MTEAVLATKGTADGAFSKMVKSDKDTEKATGQGANTGCPSAFSSKGNNTIWAYIDFLDNGTEYNDVCWDGDTRAQWELLENRKTAAVSNPGGCDDWFIPTVVEINMLGVWGGGLKYDSGSDGYSKFVSDGSSDFPDEITGTTTIRNEMGMTFDYNDHCHCLRSCMENSPSGKRKNGTLVFDNWNAGSWVETDYGKWVNSNSVIAMRLF